MIFAAADRGGAVTVRLQPRAFANGSETKRLLRRRGLPACGHVQLQHAGRARAKSGNFDFDGMGSARREKRDFGTKAERDRRNHIQPAAHFAICRIGSNLHRFVRNNQSLTADFEDLLDGKHGRIFRTTDQRGIVNTVPARACPLRAASRAGSTACSRAAFRMRHVCSPGWRASSIVCLTRLLITG